MRTKESQPNLRTKERLPIREPLEKQKGDFSLWTGVLQDRNGIFKDSATRRSKGVELGSEKASESLAKVTESNSVLVSKDGRR